MKSFFKKTKYANKKTVIDGIAFDSKGEASRYFFLKDLERAGKISNLRRQVKFVLAPAVKIEGEKRKRPELSYYADFVYLENGLEVVDDFKSPITQKLSTFRIKQHLMKTVHGIDVRVSQFWRNLF